MCYKVCVAEEGLYWTPGVAEERFVEDLPTTRPTERFREGEWEMHGSDPGVASVGDAVATGVGGWEVGVSIRKGGGRYGEYAACGAEVQDTRFDEGACGVHGGLMRSDAFGVIEDVFWARSGFPREPSCWFPNRVDAVDYWLVREECSWNRRRGEGGLLVVERLFFEELAEGCWLCFCSSLGFWSQELPVSDQDNYSFRSRLLDVLNRPFPTDLPMISESANLLQGTSKVAMFHTHDQLGKTVIPLRISGPLGCHSSAHSSIEEGKPQMYFSGRDMLMA